MNNRQEKSFKNYLSTPADMVLPNIEVNCVIMGFNEGEINILLNRFKAYGNWSLPSSFVYKDENTDDAAFRLIGSKTGIKECYIHQYAAFGGKPDEDSMDDRRRLLEESQIADIDSHWFMNRSVGIGYYAFVDFHKVSLKTSADEECKWFSLRKLPPMYGNHKDIVDKAVRTMQMEINFVPLGLELLPEKFTMGELRVIYEIILNKEIDRRNFQRKILWYGYVEKLDETSKRWGIRETTLYTFNRRKYLIAILEDGSNLF
jgi:hypothetical protein